MLVHPDINPVAVRLGPLKVHWYGLMYLLGFWGCWWLAVVRGRKPHVKWSQEQVSDILFYIVMGVILGGRLGYILFYAYTPQGQWLEALDPLTVFKVWDGGMSFHGGLLGVTVAMFIYAWQRKLNVFDVADFVAVVVPFGLLTGRIGNFINGELWGAPTALPWGMIFQRTGDNIPRHPSQLYEAALEGVVTLSVLWWFGSRPRPRMAISGLFLVLYATFRWLIEFVRVPDAQFGYLAWGWLTMGQVLSVPMFLIGAIFLWLAYRRGATSGV
jgi:phosphatidylglycerol:prolipoprotein diacylglycerol transferase